MTLAVGSEYHPSNMSIQHCFSRWFLRNPGTSSCRVPCLAKGPLRILDRDFFTAVPNVGRSPIHHSRTRWVVVYFSSPARLTTSLYLAMRRLSWYASFTWRTTFSEDTVDTGITYMHSTSSTTYKTNM